MSDNLDALFASAEEHSNAIEEQQASRKKRDERLLNINEDKTVYFRMFPDATNPEKPLMHLQYDYYQFKSVVTNQNIYAGVSPAVHGLPDFYKDKRNELYSRGSQEDKDRAKLLWPTPKRYVNIFVLSDSANPENNGTEMLLHYTAKPTDPARPKAGSPLVKAIKAALEDEDNPVKLRQLFSLGKEGATIKMVIKKPTKDDIPEFEIKILTGEVQGFKGMSKEKQMEYYSKKAIDLLDYIEAPKSQEEMEEIYQKHVLGVSGKASPNAQDDSSPQSFFNADDDDDDDDIQFDHDTDKDSATPTKVDDSSDDDEDDDGGLNVDDMLSALEVDD